jgi:predicted N-formylglutamate amidohydrolase
MLPVHALISRTAATERNAAGKRYYRVKLTKFAPFTRTKVAACRTFSMGLCFKNSHSGLLDKCLPCLCGRIPT